MRISVLARNWGGSCYSIKEVLQEISKQGVLVCQKCT